MDVYKEDLIEALEEELLSFGSWCVNTNINYDIPAKPAKLTNCKVCAVGSVFKRFTSKTPDKIRHEAETKTKGWCTPNMVGVGGGSALPKNWLTAVSYVWESLGNCLNKEYKNGDLPMEEARAQMIDWVEENVPEDTVLWSM